MLAGDEIGLLFDQLHITVIGCRSLAGQLHQLRVGDLLQSGLGSAVVLQVLLVCLQQLRLVLLQARDHALDLRAGRRHRCGCRRCLHCGLHGRGCRGCGRSGQCRGRLPVAVLAERLFEPGLRGRGGIEPAVQFNRYFAQLLHFRVVVGAVRVDLSQSVAQHAQLQHRLAELRVAVALRIGVQGDHFVRLVLQDILDQVAEHALGSALDEDARAGGVQVLDLLLEAHRVEHVLREGCGHGLRVVRVSRGAGVGKHPAVRLVEGFLLDGLRKGRLGVFDEGRVEGGRNLERVDRQAGFFQHRLDIFNTICRTGQHDLFGRIVIGDLHVRIALEDFAYGLHIAFDRGHRAAILAG